MIEVSQINRIDVIELERDQMMLREPVVATRSNLGRHLPPMKNESDGNGWVILLGRSVAIQMNLDDLPIMERWKITERIDHLCRTADGWCLHQIFLENVEHVHHYQRGRASITGLRLESDKIIETERLVVVARCALLGALILLF